MTAEGAGHYQDGDTKKATVSGKDTLVAQQTKLATLFFTYPVSNLKMTYESKTFM